MISRLNSTELVAPAAPLSHVTRAGDLVFVSGQTATDDNGNVYIGSFDQEVESALDNLQTALGAAGAALTDVVKVGAFLSSAALFDTFNTVYRSRFGDALPARTTVVCDFGNPDVRVEVDAIAYVG